MGAQHGESDGLPATCLGAPFDRFLGERRGEIQQRDDLRVVESREGGILEVDHLRLLLGDMAPVREGHGQVPQGTGPEIVGLEENGHQTGGQLADDQRLLAAVDEQDKVIDEAREQLADLALVQLRPALGVSRKIYTSYICGGYKSHPPIMVDLDGEGEGPEEPRVRAVAGQQGVGDQPCVRALLQQLQMLLDGLDFGGVALVGRVVELRHELGDGQRAVSFRRQTGQHPQSLHRRRAAEDRRPGQAGRQTWPSACWSLGGTSDIDGERRPRGAVTWRGASEREEGGGGGERGGSGRGG